MKHSVKIFLLLLLLLNGFMLMAQKHFIYVQSEDKQPFAVVLNGKVYSSSDYGYVIIPKLTDGKYDFTISFPLNKFPDQPFSCTINKKDEGFTLKNGTNGWALENFQTQATADNTASAPVNKNAFGDMLSDVVHDSSLVQKPVASPPVVAATPTPTVNPILPPQKIAEAKLDTGTNMQFVDKNETGADTISVFIPAENAATTAPATQQNVPAEKNETVAQNAQPAETTTVNNSITHVDTSARHVSNPFFKPDQNNTPAVSTASATTPAFTSNATSATKQNCNNTVANEDLNKLKRKMLSHSDDQGMIQYAVKYLNKKCISTDQVKALGQLFSSDDGRYNLYDALYTYTYDNTNYSSLSSQIIDPYYKKRFQALLR